MKQKVFSRIFLLVIFLLPILVFSSVVDKKTKVIEKEFSITSSTNVEIDNSYGMVHINTWDKNEVKVIIKIEIDAKNADKAEDQINHINVDFIQNSQLLRMKTTIKPMTSFGWFNITRFTNIDGSINYEVFMPKSNSLKISNDFGDIYLPDYDGKVEIDLDYGKLQAGNLIHKESFIKNEFGSADINSFIAGKIEASYSKINLGNAGDIQLESDFSDFKINSASSLEVNFQYGSLNLEKVNSLSGSSKFTNIDIKNLTTLINMKVEYGGIFKIENVAKNFQNINLDSEFCNFILNFESGVSYELDASIEFGKIKFPEELAAKSSIKENYNSKIIKAKVGKATEVTSKVQLDIEYGDVNLIHK